MTRCTFFLSLCLFAYLCVFVSLAVSVCLSFVADDRVFALHSVAKVSDMQGHEATPGDLLLLSGSHELPLRKVRCSLDSLIDVARTGAREEAERPKKCCGETPSPEQLAGALTTLAALGSLAVVPSSLHCLVHSDTILPLTLDDTGNWRNV